MRIGHEADTEWVRPSSHRGDGIELKQLLTAQPGAGDSFELSLMRFPGSYATPRHRHNYDQIRLALDGALNCGPGLDLTPGMIGYFPEGTYYGPQQLDNNPLALVLQFTGASGQRFLNYAELARGYQQLAECGEFTDGMYHGPDPVTGRSAVKDGYQAVWEHSTGQEMSYVAPAYQYPVLLHPDGFRWHGVAEQPGVFSKPLGEFSDARTRLDLIRLEPGARWDVAQLGVDRLLTVLMGEVAVDGHTLARYDALHVAPAEGAKLTAADGGQLLSIGLPQRAARPGDR